MPKPIYTALFLTEAAENLIKQLYPPRHPNVYAHHVTLVFKPSPTDIEFLDPLVGREFQFEVVGEAVDERGQAVKVTVPETLRVNGQVHHVTISCAKDVTPVYSNELLKKGWGSRSNEDTRVFLPGVVRHFTK